MLVHRSFHHWRAVVACVGTWIVTYLVMRKRRGGGAVAAAQIPICAGCRSLIEENADRYTPVV